MIILLTQDSCKALTFVSKWHSLKPFSIFCMRLNFVWAIIEVDPSHVKFCMVLLISSITL